LVLAGIANAVFSLARVLQYFLKISIGIGIGNTIMNIGNSFLLIPIVNTFMKQSIGYMADCFTGQRNQPTVSK